MIKENNCWDGLSSRTTLPNEKPWKTAIVCYQRNWNNVCRNGPKNYARVQSAIGRLSKTRQNSLYVGSPAESVHLSMMPTAAIGAFRMSMLSPLILCHTLPNKIAQRSKKSFPAWGQVP